MNKTTPDYRHTQVGYAVIILVGLVLAFAVFLAAGSEFIWIALAAVIVLVTCLVLFTSLTVMVYKDRIEVKFGPGLVRRRFPMGDIESCRVVKNPWYYGWGVRITPYGWLYNVSGLGAVELTMKNGKRFRIGTDAPNELADAIQRRLA